MPSNMSQSSIWLVAMYIQAIQEEYISMKPWVVSVAEASDRAKGMAGMAPAAAWVEAN